MKDVVVNTRASSTCTGRNGYFDLKAIRLTAYGTGEDARAAIDFIGKRGVALNAGAYIALEDMDTLCREWLKMRGEV